MICLDTNVLIDLGKSRQNPRRLAAEQKIKELLHRDEALFTTRINVAELMVGVHLADDSAAELAQAQRVLGPLVVLELDEKSAERFANFKAGCRQAGRPVGDADLFIAAIARVNNCSMLTRNPRHFSALPGLKVETY